jgi:hypothetical protein
MTARVSRRELIKLFGTAAVGLAFRDFPPGGNPADQPPSFTLGRAVYSLRYYEEPSFSSKELGYYIRDDVVRIIAEMAGDPGWTRNSLWLRTEDGWIHSAYVQPVKEILNTPVLKIPNGAMLSEVTVPYTQAYRVVDGGWKRFYRCYYASTYWVHLAFMGETGAVWYQIWDERNEEYYVVRAEHLRPVTAEELTPVAPGNPGKRVEIDLTRQRLIAYEGDQPVFTTRTATGYFEGDTPKGEYRIERKQPTRHMASNLEGNSFDLPGVPWVCYISWTGVSFHGTYWHHNYGTPQSHGCINLLPEAARWVYRWTEPFVPVDKDYVETDQGTPVIVY